jgi:hypothetical protein
MTDRERAAKIIATVLSGLIGAAFVGVLYIIAHFVIKYW